MMQLIVNDMNTAAPGISFPFQSITICKRKKIRKTCYCVMTSWLLQRQISVSQSLIR